MPKQKAELTIESISVLFEVMNDELPLWSYPSEKTAQAHVDAINELSTILKVGVVYKPVRIRGKWVAVRS